MSFINNDMTTAGLLLLAKAQTGVQIKFTRIVLGDGYLPNGVTIKTLENVINEVMSLEIDQCKINLDGSASIISIFHNDKLHEGFFYRELALFAENPDGNEILYCYGNAGDFAEWIPPTGSQTLKEKIIDIIIYTGQAANITANISPHACVTLEHIEEVKVIALYAREKVEEILNMLNLSSDDGNDSDNLLNRIEAIEAAIASKAPFKHDNAEKIYGGGTSELYGHVVGNDEVDSVYSADDSVFASPLAVKKLNDIFTQKDVNQNSIINSLLLKMETMINTVSSVLPKTLVVTITNSKVFNPAEHGLSGKSVDIFMAAAGGGGGGGANNLGTGAGGGGGGLSRFIENFTLSENSYNVIIGAGGIGGNAGKVGVYSDPGTDGGNGGDTTGFGQVVQGGNGGKHGNSIVEIGQHSYQGIGGNGGAGNGGGGGGGSYLNIRGGGGGNSGSPGQNEPESSWITDSKGGSTTFTVNNTACNPYTLESFGGGGGGGNATNAIGAADRSFGGNQGNATSVGRGGKGGLSFGYNTDDRFNYRNGENGGISGGGGGGSGGSGSSGIASGNGGTGGNGIIYIYAKMI